jgi:hypothetical protein
MKTSKVIAGVTGAALLALVVLLRPERRAEPREERPRAKPRPRIDRPIAGAPCTVEGLIEGGAAERVRVHGADSELDVDADLSSGGTGFSARLPEQGALYIVASTGDGRTATARTTCPGSGHVRVTLRFAPADPRAATVAGRCVYLETGAGVPDAVIRGSLGEVLVWSGLADGEGTFSVAVPPGMFGVECEKDAERSDPIAVDVEPGGRADVTMFLEAQAAVAGIVLEDGEPVPGIEVSGRSAAAPFRRALTGPDGRFVVRGLEVGPVVVEAHHADRFDEAHATAHVELPYAEVRLELQPIAVGIRGTVRDAEGPVAGAIVGVSAFPDAARKRLRRSTRTSEDGAFAVGGVVPGSYVVEAAAEGRTPRAENVEVVAGWVTADLMLETKCTTIVMVEPREPVLSVVVESDSLSHDGEAFGVTGQQISLIGPPGRGEIAVRTIGAVVRTASVVAERCAAPVVLSLEPRSASGAIEVHVEDPDGGALPNVRVWILGGPIGVTSSQGDVVFQGLEAGLYGVAAIDVEPVEVVVREGLREAIRLVVGREPGHIDGVVVRGAEPVEGAGLRAACGDTGMDRGLENAGIVARSGADGRFSFEPRDGGVCTVRAEHAAFGKSRVVTLRTNGPDARLELAAPGSIAGQVTRAPGGTLVERFVITAQAVERSGGVDARTVYVDDPSGAYRISDVAPGRVSISVTAGDERAHREVELPPGGEKTGVDLAIFGEGEVRGRIVTKEGGPIPRAEITLRDAHGDPQAETTSRDDGRFEARVPAGYLLRAFVLADGFYLWGSQPFDLDPGGKDLGDIVPVQRGGPEEKEGGIGIMFEGDPRGVRIIRFVSDSPAREAGLEIGDLITAIEGLPPGREPLVSWVVHFRGRPGTPVVLQVERGTAPPFSATVIRRSIGLDPVP